MDKSREELATIKTILRDNPRGLSVTEISRLIGMNRHSVAKYLEMLAASGQVEMQSFGPSKVYYISHRVPVSAMLDFSSNLILVLDDKNRVIQANDSFLSCFGKKFEEVSGLPLVHVCPETLSDEKIQRGIRDAREGKEFRTEEKFQVSDKELYFAVKIIPLVFEDGRRGAAIIMENITEMKKTEIELTRAKRTLELKVKNRTAELVRTQRIQQAIIDMVPNPIIALDEKCKAIIWNPAAEQMFGWSEKEVIGKDLLSLPFGSEEDVRALRRTVADGNKISRLKIRRYKKDGTPIDLCISISPIMDDTGTVIGSVGMMKKIDG